MNSVLTTDEMYMRRCLQLARNGWQNAQPNPMVGAVIVHEGRIIGEGYHVRCGEGHAEVNACASVRKEDEHLLKESTIYVSLEPCSHYGKTPPCADLLISKGFKRCVIGCQDPFAKVQGRGIQKLRDAGMEVTVGVLKTECERLNKRFMTFHGKHRPYVTLKWAESSDGFIDGHISNTYTQMICHKRRAEHQAILVGRRTFEIDHPSLNTREWYGSSPKRYVVSSQSLTLPEGYHLIQSTSVDNILHQLYEDGIQTVLVEGGAMLHQSFINSGLWDECYIEKGTQPICGHVKAPQLSSEATLISVDDSFGQMIEKYGSENSSFATCETSLELKEL
ncbi:MAG: bifunctional diaminohydroxyphosphoribosylaminopyrimidine deaminase/5-amino-6-(5-phosphoribosylamino)uracil reductase RibD [Bacteroidaceae bacterium]|nr:bifunctional diaminohydroxyphosphoribosylaminopyrimidine deaminase/5-amino-6-(5-phosphoribosylamino)uracil reductase RibD [Bacteroidaceae bacterium]